jgi:hypothetical protein
MSKRTVIHWSWDDLNMRVETLDAMTPEAIETMLRRTGGQFVRRARELYGYVNDDDEEAAEAEAAAVTDE